jgi:hypothetical protein
VVLDAQLAARASEVEWAVRELTVGSDSADLEGLARFTAGPVVSAGPRAVEELADAGIVARRRVDRGTTGYLATEVFDLLMYAERSELVRSP